MTNENIIRAWKDPHYRETLTAEQFALIPEHPAGPIELSDSDLDDVAGGFDWLSLNGSCGIWCHVSKSLPCPSTFKCPKAPYTAAGGSV